MIILGWLLIGIPLAAQTEPPLTVEEPTTAENACHDAASWQAWQDLLAQTPQDMDLHTLHALRLGLCVKVARGDLQVDEATTIFEDARQALLAQRRAQRVQDERRHEQPL
jgi:hypothetical protein